MTTVKSFIDEDAALTEDPAGYEQTVTYDVSGLTGPSSHRMYNAAIAPGVPRMGDSHPVIPSLQVVDRRIEPSGTGARVFVRYRIPGTADLPLHDSLEFGATTANEITNEDINGDLMRVEWSGADTDLSDIRPIQTISIFSSQVVEFDVAKPQVTATMARFEDEVPRDLILRFVGAVNRDRWSDSSPKTWLCTGIRTIPARQSGLVQVRYDFAYKPDTWIAEATIRVSVTTSNTRGTGTEEDPLVINNNVIPISVTDKIPKNAELGNGIERFDVYPALNFSELGFDI